MGDFSPKGVVFIPKQEFPEGQKGVGHFSWEGEGEGLVRLQTRSKYTWMKKELQRKWDHQNIINHLKHLCDVSEGSGLWFENTSKTRLVWKWHYGLCMRGHNPPYFGY